MTSPRPPSESQDSDEEEGDDDSDEPLSDLEDLGKVKWGGGGGGRGAPLGGDVIRDVMPARRGTCDEG